LSKQLSWERGKKKEKKEAAKERNEVLSKKEADLRKKRKKIVNGHKTYKCGRRKNLLPSPRGENQTKKEQRYWEYEKDRGKTPRQPRKAGRF